MARLGLPYLLIPGLSAITPVIVLPAISQSFGVAGWNAVAIAQSLGATAAVAIGLGWGLSGTQRVARQTRRAVARTFVASMLTRSLAAALLIPLVVVGTLLLVPEHRIAAILIAVGTALTGFSAGWVFVGTGRPAHIMYAEAIPRVILTGIAAVLILAGQPLVWYGIALVTASLLAIVLPWRLLAAERADATRWSARRIVRLTGRQWPALTSGLLSTAYMSFSTAAVAMVAPGALPLFAAMDRVMRMTLQVLFGMNRMLQKWVGGAPDARLRIHRAFLVVLATTAAAAFCGVAFAVGCPLAVELLFAGTLAVPTEVAVASGALLAVIMVSNSTGNTLLVALGRTGGVALSAGVGCAVGLPLILWGAHVGGAFGGIMGQLTAEGAVVVTQAVVAGVAARRRRVG